MKDMYDWCRSILQAPHRMAIPLMTSPGIDLVGCTMRDAVTRGSCHADVICQLNSQWQASACTAIMDLTVEAEAFGAEVLFTDHEVPTVAAPCLTTCQDIDALVVPDITCGRVPQYLQANTLVASRISDKPIFGGCIGPFSLACRLYDMSELMMALFIEPHSIHHLLSKCALFIQRYIAAMKETGIDGVIMAEPAAGLISDEQCREFSTAYIRPIVDAVQDAHFLVVLHNCGNRGHCTSAMVDTGARALHFGNAIDIKEALDACPPDVIVMGNIDPVNVMCHGTPLTSYDATLALLRRVGHYPNFVLSTGCDVPPGTPADNIRAFYQALSYYNQHR